MKPTTTTKIAAGIHQIAVGEGAHEGVYVPNVYLIAGGAQAAFVDTAYGNDDEISAHLSHWRALGQPPIAAIILTHRHGDHIGGALRLREATAAPLACSADERAAIEADLGASVDMALADGDTLDLGGATLEFIHTPGHTLGSLSILHRQTGTLFSGDMILGTGTTVISPEHGDMSAYIASMRKLLRYDSQRIAPGHGPVIDTPQAKLNELITHRLAREEQIVELLAAGNRTIDDLLNAIYAGNIHPGLMDTARSQIRAHLIKLERDGRARAAGADAYDVAPITTNGRGRTMLDFERYEVLTFDCYGTLIDWEGGITDALMPVATARGVSVSADELLRLYAEFEAAGKSGEYRAYRDVLRSTARAICERLGFAPTDAEANCLVDSIGVWRPFADTVEALRRLKTRYRLCVVSNVDDDLFAGTQRTLGVEFDGVVTAQQAGSYKPSHNNFNLALERMGVARDRALHIAESVKLDIAPAKALGIDAVWVNRNQGSGKQGSASGNPTDGASGADLEVPDLRTLTELMGL